MPCQTTFKVPLVREKILGRDGLQIKLGEVHINLGLLKHFLGIEVARNADEMYLSQRKYALDIFYERGLSGSKPTPIPIEQNHHLTTVIGPFMSLPEKYRRLVGRLIYLTITRLELSYSINILDQFMTKSWQEHWDTPPRVVRHFKSSPKQGIFLSVSSPLVKTAYCDANWASCHISQCFLTRYFIFLENSPISWKTKEQANVSRSLVEGEYRPMAVTCCELKRRR